MSSKGPCSALRPSTGVHPRPPESPPAAGTQTGRSRGPPSGGPGPLRPPPSGGSAHGPGSKRSWTRSTAGWPLGAASPSGRPGRPLAVAQHHCTKHSLFLVLQPGTRVRRRAQVGLPARHASSRRILLEDLRTSTGCWPARSGKRGRKHICADDEYSAGWSSRSPKTKGKNSETTASSMGAMARMTLQPRCWRAAAGGARRSGCPWLACTARGPPAPPSGVRHVKRAEAAHTSPRTGCPC